MISHEALSRYSLWAAATYFPTPGKTVPLHSALSFDLTVTSLFAPLLAGGTIRVYRQEASEPAIERVLREGAVEVLKLTPSHLVLVRDHRLDESRLERLIVGGEELPTALAREVWAATGGTLEIWNEYGPTEATVGCMLQRFESDEDRPAVAIGRPAPDTQIYLLDDGLEPVPTGAVGELVIGGPVLANGYFGRPDLTAERFVPHPFANGERLYRSGDLARHTADGRVHFLGRRDQQVKFHGHRLEFDEIRSALIRHPEVRDAVLRLVADRHGDKVLVVYYVARRELEVRDLRDFLSTKVPQEVIPNLFVHLRRLPLNLHGKVNFQALPGLEEIRRSTSRTALRTARTPTEELLAGIWCEVLGLPAVGLDDQFFELGGHSLLGTRVISRVREWLGLEIPLRELFAAPRLGELAARIDAVRRRQPHPAPPRIRPVANRDALPLSFAQQRLWLVEQLEPGNAAYNTHLPLLLSGRLDAAALAMALAGVVRRHEVLRTAFVDRHGEPALRLDPPCPVPLAVLDLSDLPAAHRETELRGVAFRESRRPFDLAHTPLLRGTLLYLEECKHALLLTMHHLVADGWSLGVLRSEVASLYQAAQGGATSALPDLPIQYADFAHWQRSCLSGENLAVHLAFWRRYLEAAPPYLDLPTDRPRPATLSYRGARHQYLFAPSLTAALHDLCRSERVTLFMVLLAAIQVLLYRYSGQTDIIVGSPIANRNRLETEGLIGFFVNVLALRTRLSGELTVRELLGRVRDSVLDASAHQDLPFEKVLEEMKPERLPGRQPLFQIVFTLQNSPLPPLKLPQLTLAGLDIDTRTAKFDLTFNAWETPAGLAGSIEHSTDLFEEATAHRMWRHLERLLASLVADPNTRLDSLPIFSAEEDLLLAKNVGIDELEAEFSL